MTPLNIVILLAQMSETSTATWGVLMLVVGFLTAAVFAGWRIYSTKLSDANKRAEANEEKANDARHDQVITKIEGVHGDVHTILNRMDRAEGDISELKENHAELRGRVDQIGGAS